MVIVYEEFPQILPPVVGADLHIAEDSTIVGSPWRGQKGIVIFMHNLLIYPEGKPVPRFTFQAVCN